MCHKNFMLFFSLLIASLSPIHTYAQEAEIVEALEDLTDAVDNLAKKIPGKSGGWRSFLPKISNPFKSTIKEESEELGEEEVEEIPYFGSPATDKENWRHTEINGVTIELVQGSVTDIYNVDAIVNAANPQLDPGGFVSGAIFRAAGPALNIEIDQRKDAGLIPEQLVTGQAVATSSHNLKSHNIDFIIHAAGPDFSSNSSLPLSLVGDTYQDALREATQLHVNRIAFPLISAGVYKGNKISYQQLAQQTWTALKNYAENYYAPRTNAPAVIIVIAHTKEEFNAYAKEFDTILLGKKSSWWSWKSK